MNLSGFPQILDISTIRQWILTEKHKTLSKVFAIGLNTKTSVTEHQKSKVASSITSDETNNKC